MNTYPILFVIVNEEIIICFTRSIGRIPAMELIIKDMSQTYPNGVRALKNVNLTVSSGMFGLLGPNGAGKSTLMRIIATLQDPQSGSVTLNGIDVLKQKHEIRKILGYLPQEFGLDPKVSAEDLLIHFAALKGIPAGERKSTVKSLLEQANLGDHRKKKLGGFSGGMKQRFGIAQALLANPKLLIVDEPTAGLDPEERIRFHNILSEIGEHVVVILSTHIVDDVSDLCSRMAVIHNGEVLLEAEPRQTIDNLDGKIWRATIEKTALPEFRDRYQIISTKLFAGRTRVRVFSETPLNTEFEPVEPSLEDVYFLTLHSRENAPVSV